MLFQLKFIQNFGCKFELTKHVYSFFICLIFAPVIKTIFQNFQNKTISPTHRHSKHNQQPKQPNTPILTLLTGYLGIYNAEIAPAKFIAQHADGAPKLMKGENKSSPAPERSRTKIQMAFVVLKKCLKEPKHLLKLIVLIVCVCVASYQVSIKENKY